MISTLHCDSSAKIRYRNPCRRLESWLLSPGLKECRGYDNAVGIVEFHGGKVAYFSYSQMMAHGQEDATEIIDTEGKLSVNEATQLRTTHENNFVTC